MKLPAEETASANPGHTWGDDVAAPVNAPVTATAASEKDTAAKPSKPAKPKKDKPVKITKSAAAALKETLEKRSLGDKTPVAPKAGKKTDKPKATIKKLTPKTAQRDMVTEGKLFVPEPTSPLFKAGKRLSEAAEQEELAKDEKAEAMQEVVKAMRNAKRYVYKAGGYSFELVHKGAEDKVKIIKPK